jgi:hypothetical protein
MFRQMQISDELMEHWQFTLFVPGSLSDLKNRSAVAQAGKPLGGCSQNLAGRGQILTILPGNSYSIAPKSAGVRSLSGHSTSGSRKAGLRPLLTVALSQLNPVE